jgi:hypothetical protein
MKVLLFVLNQDQKRKLIEMMLIVFSIIVVLPGRIAIESNTFGIMPSLFLLFSIFYWIASHEERAFKHPSFMIVSAFISFSFGGMLSAKVIEFTAFQSPIILEMLFWAYYFVFSFILFFALTSDGNTTKKKYLRTRDKIVLAILFVIVIYLLSKIF